MLRILIFVFLAYPSLGLMAEVGSAPPPKGLFSAVFWDKFKSATLHYAPWGNANEENASMEMVPVNFFSPSRKFAYYGESPLEFFSQIYSEDGTETNYSKIGEFAFSSQATKTQESLFLLFSKPDSQTFKVYPIGFGPSEVPFGSIKVFSQAGKTLYMTFGKEKIVLASGKSKLLQPLELSGKSNSTLVVFENVGGKYEKVFSRNLVFERSRRGVAFFSMEKKRLRFKLYQETATPLESSIGFNANPLQVAEPNTEQKVKSPNSGTAPASDIPQ